MSSSNYNKSIFIVAMEIMGQIKWRTDSRVAQNHLINSCSLMTAAAERVARSFRLGIEGLLVHASPSAASLSCALEQDTLSAA